MKSSKDVDSSTSTKLTQWLSQHPNNEQSDQHYPVRPNRFYFSQRQDCYTDTDVALMERVRGAYNRLTENSEKPYFDTNEEKHWYGWWECTQPAYDSMLRKHDDEPFTLPNRESKDSKAFPLWDYADHTARRIANWQAERAQGQKAELMNDPVMLIFEELRDWFFHVLSMKECKKEDLAYLTKRQSYIKNLIHIIPDFGKDRLRLQEIQQSLEDAYKISLAHIANRELPQLLSGIIIDAKSLESTLGTYLHFLLPNEEVADNFSPSCLDANSQACDKSPVSKVYYAARNAALTEKKNDAMINTPIARFHDLNSLYHLTAKSDGNDMLLLPELRTESADAIQFASFVTPEDKRDYVEALAVLEALTKVRGAMENFRNVQTSIGTYFFAYNYLDKTARLASNYINLVSKANTLLSKLIQAADAGMNKILSNPVRYKAINKHFQDNMRTLEMSVVHDTTLKDQLDEYCRKAVTSMNQYNNKMEELVSDIHSGKATDEVERAMQELFMQVNDLNMMLTAVLNNKEFLIGSDTLNCKDQPFTRECSNEQMLLADGQTVTHPISKSDDTSGLNIPMETKIHTAWDATTKPHPVTSIPVYTYRIFHDGAEIGSAEYYGQPSICVSHDGTQHNMIKRTGFLKEIPAPAIQEITNICENPLPTILDRALASAKQAASFGALRGVTTLTGDALHKAGYSQNTAGVVSQILYYSSYFTSRYYTYSQQTPPLSGETYHLNAMYQAAVDTGQKFVLSTALNRVSAILDQAGEKLENNDWSNTGYAVRKLGTFARYGIFATSTIENGIIESTAALAAGTATEAAIGQAGKYLLGN